MAHNSFNFNSEEMNFSTSDTESPGLASLESSVGTSHGVITADDYTSSDSIHSNTFDSTYNNVNSQEEDNDYRNSTINNSDIRSPINDSDNTNSPVLQFQHSIPTDDIESDSNDGNPISMMIQNIERYSLRNNIERYLPCTSNNNDHNISDNSNSSVENVEEPPSKIPKIDLNESTGEGQNCPICFESWTSAGNHRLVSLKCGHLFGYSCITKWLKSVGNKSCPTCKKPSSSSDIRFIYAKSVSFVDNSEIESYKQKLEKLETEYNRKKMEVIRMKTLQDAYITKIDQLQETIHNLQNNTPSVNKKNKRWWISVEKNIDITKENSCRVLVHNSYDNSLYISQANTAHLFPGYGIRQIKCDSYEMGNLKIIHSKEIRGLIYSRDINSLLSVSFDKSVKLHDINRSNGNITFSTGFPLWSCCWDHEHENRFYVGSMGGYILYYDIRQTKSHIRKFEPDTDMSPVISLLSVPGALLACHLNSVSIHPQVSSEYTTSTLPLRGSFFNMSYNPGCKQLIVSAKPNSDTPYCKYYVYNLDILEIERGNFEIINTFKGSSMQKLMSKSCQFSVNGEHIFATGNEEKSTLDLWNVSKKFKVLALPSREPTIDICKWNFEDEIYFGGLTQNRIKIFKIFNEHKENN